MKALLEDLKTGEIISCEVPPPELRPGGILVRTHFSAISAGTERVKVETGEKSLIQKALARPDLVKQVIQHARQNGVVEAYRKVQAKLDSLSTMGYSAAGVVLEVAEGVSEFRRGDRVACGGGGYANHCEINFVPRNLAAKVPDAVPLDVASLTTIAAIAMQGLRQSGVVFGETVAVIGAGLVGAITMQLARAAGCRVIALDLNPSRVERASSFGAHFSILANDPAVAIRVRQFAEHGVDAAIITAATHSAAPVELAAEICRDRGAIVIVGDVGMGVSRAHMYHKELRIIMSRSYGPGRYDPHYEEEGQDYPVGFVRWTEKRNMEAVLALAASQSLDFSPFLEKTYPVDAGAHAYKEILGGGAYTAIISYGQADDGTATAPPVSVTSTTAARAGKLDVLRVGCIGAGGFARSIIFPALRANKHVAFESVATSSGVAAESARRGFRFARAETPAALLENPLVDAVFVLSRHDSHARYVGEALSRDKRVFVEKPLAINLEEVGEIERIYDSRRTAGHAPFLMVGFNRRFAPATEKLQAFFAQRREPMLVHVRVNAGFQSADSWVHADGGRIVGEFCHFIDWARAVIGKHIQSVEARALPDSGRYHEDNISATLTFADGSIANLLYLANGDPSVPKEYFEVFCEGAVARLDDFSTLTLARRSKVEKFRFAHDKGHSREIDLTLEAMISGGPSPIPFEELIEVTQAALAVRKAIFAGPSENSRLTVPDAIHA
jgi:polar amino acid transport system substrate-binding protein